MDGKAVGLGRLLITVVQPAQSIMGNHATRGYPRRSDPGAHGKIVHFYTFEKKPIIVAFALDKSVVARRTDREVR
ncbi:MAG: hypothetical protein DME36_13705 [Verrucomicrobia bacterium]|nr:MAG: hypothetical protein DME36_13705 [Verrucomicrobiota bacterium]